MAQFTELPHVEWTAADVVARFGPIPIHRIRMPPEPGTATEDDVLAVHDRENRLCELVEGTLVEKTVGNYESYLAVRLATRLERHVEEHNLGLVLGADGMMRLAPGLVRIPDVSFISWDRLPGRHIPEQPIWRLAPDLAVEVISAGNTREEMDRKLHEYFEAGVREAWYVYPPTRELHRYTAPNRATVYAENDALDGGDLLPGFRLELKAFFAPPSGR